MMVCSSFNFQYKSTGVGSLSSLGKIIGPRRSIHVRGLLSYNMAFTVYRECSFFLNANENRALKNCHGGLSATRGWLIVRFISYYSELVIILEKKTARGPI